MIRDAALAYKSANARLLALQTAETGVRLFCDAPVATIRLII
jgi:hypothetical protein